MEHVNKPKDVCLSTRPKLKSQDSYVLSVATSKFIPDDGTCDQIYFFCIFYLLT